MLGWLRKNVFTISDTPLWIWWKRFDKVVYAVIGYLILNIGWSKIRDSFTAHEQVIIETLTIVAGLILAVLYTIWFFRQQRRMEYLERENRELKESKDELEGIIAKANDTITVVDHPPKVQMLSIQESELLRQKDKEIAALKRKMWIDSENWQEESANRIRQLRAEVASINIMKEALSTEKNMISRELEKQTSDANRLRAENVNLQNEIQTLKDQKRKITEENFEKLSATKQAIFEIIKNILDREIDYYRNMKWQTPVVRYKDGNDGLKRLILESDPFIVSFGFNDSNLDCKYTIYNQRGEELFISNHYITLDAFVEKYVQMMRKAMRNYR